MRITIILLAILTFHSSTFSISMNPYFRFSETDKIEKFKNGIINWSQGYILAKAKKVNVADQLKTLNGRNSIMDSLLLEAKKNLLNIILMTKVNSYQTIRDFFNNREDFKTLLLEKFEKHIQRMPPVFLGTGEVELVLQYPIFGDGSLSYLLYKLNDNVEKIPDYIQGRPHEQEPIIYSSLVIDLRTKYQFYEEIRERLDFYPKGLKFPTYLSSKIRYDKKKKSLVFKGGMTLEERDVLLSLSNDSVYQEAISVIYEQSQNSEKAYNYEPSVFPSIYDSQGKLIYAKSMVKLNSRNLKHYIQYTKDSLIFYKVEEVGENPLLIIADKIKGENLTDIVISPEDAKKLFLHKKTMKNIVKGKIYLLVN